MIPLFTIILAFQMFNLRHYNMVYKDENGIICLNIFSVEDENHVFPINMEIGFIDNQKAYIVCYPQGIWFSDRTLSPENPWIWYRLSGPEW